MNSLIFLIFYIVLRVATKDWEESLYKPTPKRNNAAKPFSKNSLKNILNMYFINELQKKYM